MFSRIRTIVCAFILTGAIATTAFAEPPKAAPGIRRLVASWNLYAGHMNLHLPLHDPCQLYAQEMAYDPLVAYRSNGTIGSSLADRWEISPDGKVYTFYLKKMSSFLMALL